MTDKYFVMDQQFGKQEKLKSKIIINKLFTDGSSLKKYPLRLIYHPVPNQEINKVAVSVPKKTHRRAVDRTRLKRLVREVYRKNKYIIHNELNDSYALMFIYTSKETVSFQFLSSTMENLLKHLKKRVNNL